MVVLRNPEVGDRVRVSVQYQERVLHGLEGTVVARDPDWVMWPYLVELDTPPAGTADSDGLYHFDQWEISLLDENYPSEVPD